MSNTLKLVAALGLVAVAAACSPKEEEVVIIEPVMEEPTMSKY